MIRGEKIITSGLARRSLRSAWGSCSFFSTHVVETGIQSNAENEAPKRPNLAAKIRATGEHGSLKSRKLRSGKLCSSSIIRTFLQKISVPLSNTLFSKRVECLEFYMVLTKIVM